MSTSNTSDGLPRPNEPEEKTAITQGQLRSIIERIERLEEEKKEIADDIKEVYGETKANGFDNKTVRKIIAYRKKDKTQREEEEAMFELYWSALNIPVPKPAPAPKAPAKKPATKKAVTK